MDCFTPALCAGAGILATAWVLKEFLDGRAGSAAASAKREIDSVPC